MDSFGDMDSIAKKSLVVLLLALAAIVVLMSADPASTRRMEISAAADVPGALQVFFDTGKGFNEAQSRTVRIGTSRALVSVELPEEKILRLRLDPSEKQKWVRFHEIRVGGAAGQRLEPLAPSSLRARKSISRVVRGQGYVEARMSGQGAKDPQLLLQFEDAAGRATASVAPWLAYGARALLWLFALVAVAIGCSRTGNPVPRSMPWLLAMAGMLVLGMAFGVPTNKSVHPDEATHVQAAAYYFSHWIPGAPNDPGMAATYTPHWGISYLNTLDVAYFLAAKFSSLWKGIAADPVVALRLFNVLLLLSLAALAYFRREFIPTFSVLLLTPQIWYVFGYFNGDALPLFLSMLAVALVATSDNAVSRFIRGEAGPTWHTVLFVIAIGLLLVSKRNYLVVVYFVGMLMAWRHLKLPWIAMLAAFLGVTLGIVKASTLGVMSQLWPTVDTVLGVGSIVLLLAFLVSVLVLVVQNVDTRRPLRRLAAVFLLAGLVAMPRIAVDLWVNGGPSEKAGQVRVAAEKYARPSFKPSTIENDLDSAHPGLRFASRDVSLSEMLWARHSWIKTSWRSSLGVYGRMDVYAPWATYWLLTVGILIFAAGILAHALRSRAARGTAWIGLSSLLLIVLSAVFFSWFYGYQPQGRYLFAAIPIIGGVVAASVEDGLKTRWVSTMLIACFIVSVVSFAGAVARLS